jgi:hypothetical protein
MSCWRTISRTRIRFLTLFVCGHLIVLFIYRSSRIFLPCRGTRRNREWWGIETHPVGHNQAPQKGYRAMFKGTGLEIASHLSWDTLYSHGHLSVGNFPYWEIGRWTIAAAQFWWSQVVVAVESKIMILIWKYILKIVGNHKRVCSISLRDYMESILWFAAIDRRKDVTEDDGSHLKIDERSFTRRYCNLPCTMEILDDTCKWKAQI